MNAIDTDTFAEIEHSTSRPMEYRRDVRRIWATITSWDLRLETASDSEIAQRRKWRADREKRDADLGPITFHERLSQTLSADLDLPKREFGTITAEGTRPIDCSIRLQISASDEEVGRFRHWPKSSHDGEAMFCNVTIRHERMDWLVAELAKRPAARLMISFELLAFEYEVDEALGEPWMHKIFFVEPDAPATVTSFQAIILDDHKAPASPSSDSNDDFPDHVPSLDSGQNDPPPMVHQSNAFGTLESVAKGIQLALWVIALLLLISLFQ